MTIQILNSKRFPLRGTNGRFVHLATLGWNLREFLCFLDTKTGQVYIEEITGGHLEYIQDESLWEALALFAREKGLTTIQGGDK